MHREQVSVRGGGKYKRLVSSTHIAQVGLENTCGGATFWAGAARASSATASEMSRSRGDKSGLFRISSAANKRT